MWLKTFVFHESGAVFNFVVAQIMFWLLGAPVFLNYDYKSNAMDGSNGEVVSGPSGSGVVPITSFLMGVATIILFLKLV